MMDDSFNPTYQTKTVLVDRCLFRSMFNQQCVFKEKL